MEHSSDRVRRLRSMHRERHPIRCPNGHPWQLDGKSFTAGWDNTHRPPCRVYYCQSCDGVWHVENIRYWDD